MKKIALIIGHNEKNKGAYSEYLKISEYDFYSKVLDVLFKKYKEAFNLKEKFVKNIQDKITIFRVPNTGYSKEMAEVINTLEKNNFELAIELHFNATVEHKQHGNTVLYWHKSMEGKKFAELFQEIMTSYTEIKKLDLIPISSLKQNGAYGIIKSKCPYILLEPFFGDNKIDTDKINIEKMAEVLFLFLNEINQVKINTNSNLEEENKRLKKALLEIKNRIGEILDETL